MNQLDELDNFKRQVGMYFDQELDPPTREAFLQRLESDPDCRDWAQDLGASGLLRGMI